MKISYFIRFFHFTFLFFKIYILFINKNLKIYMSSSPDSPKITYEDDCFYFRLDTEFSQNQKSVLVPFIHNLISRELTHINENYEKKLLFFDNKITSSMKELENKIRIILDKTNHTFEQISFIKVQTEKIDGIEKSILNHNEHIIDNDVRIGSIRKDLDNACFKYDKIYLNNLIVSGYIGEYCKYKNLKEFLEHAITKLNQFEIFKQKEEIMFKDFKKETETRITNLSKLVDSFFVTNVNYIDMKLKELKNNVDTDINIVKEKIPNIQVDYNSQINKIKDSLMEEFNIFKNDMEKELDITSRDLKDQINQTNHIFRTNRREYSQVKTACLNIAEFLKNNRFNKTLNSEKSFSPSEINNLANDIIYSLKNSKKEMKKTKKSSSHLDSTISQKIRNQKSSNNSLEHYNGKPNRSEIGTPRKKYEKKSKGSDFKHQNRRILSTNNILNLKNALKKKESNNTIIIQMNDISSSSSNNSFGSKSSFTLDKIKSSNEITEKSLSKSRKSKEKKNEFNQKEEINNNNIQQLIKSNQQIIENMKNQSEEKIFKLEEKINELISTNNSLKKKVMELENDKNDDFNFNNFLMMTDGNKENKPKISVPKFPNGRGFPPSKIRKKIIVKKQSLSQYQTSSDEPMFGLQTTDFNNNNIKNLEKKNIGKTYYVNKLISNSKILNNNKKKTRNEERNLLKNFSMKFLKPMRDSLINIPQINLKKTNS